MSRRATAWRALIAFAVVAVSLFLALTTPARLGLDLSGGTRIVLQAQEAQGRTPDAESTDRALEVLRQRVDALGVAEPQLVRSGSDRIVVELPGVQDPREAAEVIGRTAQLTFHPVRGEAEKAAPQAEDGSRALADPDRPDASPKATQAVAACPEGKNPEPPITGGPGRSVSTLTRLTSGGTRAIASPVVSGSAHQYGAPPRRLAAHHCHTIRAASSTGPTSMPPASARNSARPSGKALFRIWCPRRSSAASTGPRVTTCQVQRAKNTTHATGAAQAVRHERGGGGRGGVGRPGTGGEVPRRPTRPVGRAPRGVWGGRRSDP